MTEFVFEHITMIVRTFSIVRETLPEAEAALTCGPLDRVLVKEGVRQIDYHEAVNIQRLMPGRHAALDALKAPDADDGAWPADS